jgi:hypothetical protein
MSNVVRRHPALVVPLSCFARFLPPGRPSTAVAREEEVPTMRPKKPTVAAVQPIWDDGPAPDVWWGENGIDALIWADGRPCDGPTDPPRFTHLMSRDAK